MVSPEPRRCLFCEATPPDDLATEDMHGHRRWYSNSLRNTEGVEARFYLCPHHKSRAAEAWEWAKGRFGVNADA